MQNDLEYVETDILRVIVRFANENPFRLFVANQSLERREHAEQRIPRITVVESTVVQINLDVGKSNDAR